MAKTWMDTQVTLKDICLRSRQEWRLISGLSGSVSIRMLVNFVLPKQDTRLVCIKKTYLGVVVHSPGGGRGIRNSRSSSVILDAGESKGEPIPGEGVLWIAWWKGDMTLPWKIRRSLPTPHGGLKFQHRLYLHQGNRVPYLNRVISSPNRKLFVTLCGLELNKQEVGFGDTLAPCSSRKQCTKCNFDYNGPSLSPVLLYGNAPVKRILLLGIFSAPVRRTKEPTLKTTFAAVLEVN